MGSQEGGVAERSGNGSETSPFDVDGDLRRLGRLLGAGIVAITIIVVALPFTAEDIEVQEVEPWLDGGTTVSRIELRRDVKDLRFNEEAALKRANRRLSSMVLGNVTTVDPQNPAFESRLLMDFKKGGAIYWEFTDSMTEIRIDAEDGEITYYLRRGEGGGHGPFQEDTTIALMMDIASQFAPIPLEVSEPKLWPSYRTFGQGGTVNRTIYNCALRTNRTFEGLNTTDSIFIGMYGNGVLWYYLKNWYMNLEGLDTSYTVTREEAIETTWKYAGSEYPIRLCEKRIIRPTGVDKDIYYYMTDPLCVWWIEYEVAYERDLTFPRFVAVHPRMNGTIVDVDKSTIIHY